MQVASELPSLLSPSRAAPLPRPCSSLVQSSQPSQPSKSTSSDKPIKSIDEVNTLCYAYWDGRRWQAGKTEGDKFLRLKMGRYGVHVLTFSLPIQMANEFGLSKESSADVDVFKGEIGKFMNENWYQLEALCNFR